jgi:hypothetical protein
MSFLDEELIGDETSPVLGRWSVGDERKEEFKAWLIETEGVTYARASQIATQARQYYIGDTGTVTSRPHRARVNTFAARQLRSYFGEFPVALGRTTTDSIIEQNPAQGYQRRFSSGDIDPETPFEYVNNAALLGLAFISAEGDFAIAVVAKQSP